MKHQALHTRLGFRRAVILGTLFPILFIVLGLLWQSNLGNVWHQAWGIAIFIFILGALTVTLPGRVPLIASFVVILVCMWLSGSGIIPFGGFLILCFVLAGFFFGLGVRSINYQVREQRKAAK